MNKVVFNKVKEKVTNSSNVYINCNFLRLLQLGTDTFVFVLSGNLSGLFMCSFSNICCFLVLAF